MIGRDDVFFKVSEEFYEKLPGCRYEDSDEPDQYDVSRVLGLCRKKYKHVIEGALELIRERWDEQLALYHEVMEDEYMRVNKWYI